MRTTNRLSSAVSICAAAVLASALSVGACSDSIHVGDSISDGGGDGGGGPTFTGDAGSGPTSSSSSSGATGKANALQCASNHCAPGYATCSDSTFSCDVDLTSNNNHCGSCSVACPNSSSDLNARSVCANGTCQLTCNVGFADCNGIIDDGCEQILDEVNNCGACGHACAAGQPCIDIAPFVSIGKCGCPDGKTWCGSSCVDLGSSDANCGACGNACPPPPSSLPPLGPNEHYGCVAGTCATPKCDDPGGYPPKGYADCNGNTVDGCEANVFGDNNNCGSCGTVCPAGETCAILQPSNMPGCACAPGSTKCTQASNPGFASCVDILTDKDNCGACGARCDGNDGVVCDNGVCVQLCPDGYAECNGDPRDPCETNIMTDPYHCGGCNTHCDATLPQPCQGGRCWTEDCDAGPVN
ncbi:MAG: Tryptophan synthase alpha chain [Myxococcaceae bacterium]|nr:Tryptophan synthase alpha chain [Myxococcaceae bacterium]